MQNVVAHFVAVNSGATSIEYSLIAVLVSVAIIGAVRLLGSQLMATYAYVSAALTNG